MSTKQKLREHISFLHNEIDGRDKLVWNAAIEECARVAQKYWRVRSGSHTESVYDAIAAAIRALKESR